MSINEWESGGITIPAAQWAGFRTTLIKAWNDKQLQTFEKAKVAHAAAKLAIKGLRTGTDSLDRIRRNALYGAIAKVCGGTWDQGYFVPPDVSTRYGHTKALENPTDARGLFESIRDLIVTGRQGKTLGLQAPKKGSLKLAPVTRDFHAYIGEASIALSNELRRVVWNVPENNRACERANAHWFAGLLFAELDKVTWTRGSGGVITGNNEYNRESRAQGHLGSNYTVKSYGPKP